MSDTVFKVKGMSAFTLKMLACLFMLCDHIGYILLPDVIALRWIGRLSFPLFAYFIAEGCRYTKNKLRRFLSVFVLAFICELVFVLFSKEYYGNILLTFSVSILLIYLLDSVKKVYVKSKKRFLLLLICFIFSLFATYFYCIYIGLDYGFFGVMTPVFISTVDNIEVFAPRLCKYVDRKAVSLFMLSLSLLLMCIFFDYEDYQILSLLSVFLLAMYNGERGKYSLKYFFYVFYPLHLALLQGIAFILQK